MQLGLCLRSKRTPSALDTKPHIIQLLPSANTIRQRGAHWDDLRRVKMRDYNKGDFVYVVITLTRIQWVRSSLQKLLPWTKGLFIKMKPSLRSRLYHESVPLSGTNSCLSLTVCGGKPQQYGKTASEGTSGKP